MGSSTVKIAGLFLFLALIISLSTFGLLKGFVSSDGSGLSRQDIEVIVKEVIQNNPDLIIQSLTDHQERAEIEGEQKAQQAILENKQLLEEDPTSPVAGNPEGYVVIVEFFDYSCGYCKKVLPTLMQLLEEDKGLKLVFKEFPILGPNSELASHAALAVHMLNPDKYVEFHKKLMETRVAGRDAILKIAADIGLDPAKVSEKMDSEEVAQVIENNKQLASMVGVRGTPAFTINGEFVPGAIGYEQFKEKIKAARQGNAESE